jgi:hypothetical protein
LSVYRQRIELWFITIKRASGSVKEAIKLRILKFDAIRDRGSECSGVQGEICIASCFAFGYARTGRDANCYPGVSADGQRGCSLFNTALGPLDPGNRYPQSHPDMGVVVEFWKTLPIVHWFSRHLLYSLGPLNPRPLSPLLEILKL